MPRWRPPTAFSTNEDTPLTVPAAGVLANDTDIDGDALTAVLVGGAGARRQPDAQRRRFVHLHAGRRTTTARTASPTRPTTAPPTRNTVTVTLTVNAVNDAPVASADSSSTNEDTPLTVAAPGVLGNDTDVDSPTLTAILVTGPAHTASFTLNADGSLHLHAGRRTTTARTASPTRRTTVRRTRTRSRSRSPSNPVNDAPVATADSFSTNEDTPLTVGAPGVLANDADIDSSTLTAAVVTGPTHASGFALNPNGSFTYTPAPDYNGSDGFTYKANDGTVDGNTVTVTINVVAVNDAPVVTATPGGSQSLFQNAAIAPVTVSAGDVDSAGSALRGLDAVQGGCRFVQRRAAERPQPLEPDRQRSGRARRGELDPLRHHERLARYLRGAGERGRRRHELLRRPHDRGQPASFDADGDHGRLARPEQLWGRVHRGGGRLPHRGIGHAERHRDGVGRLVHVPVHAGAGRGELGQRDRFLPAGLVDLGLGRRDQAAHRHLQR